MKEPGDQEEVMKKRDIKIDLYKGLLVIGMIYCHVLQFFIDLGDNTIANYITWYINAITFSGFVFTFGYTSYIAYFSKSFKASYLRIMTSIGKLVIAFYISGISFRVLVEHRPIFWGLVRPIIFLNDIPGWSEFIISFALFMCVSLVLFVPIKKLVEHKKLFWIVVVLLLMTTYIPYDKINNIHLGLFLGTQRFAAFPVVQYMPFFLLGIYFKRYEIGFDIKVLLGGGVLSGIALWSMSQKNWILPNRFSPSLFWIILPTFVLVLYYYLCYFMEKKGYQWKWLLLLGQNSIVYLLLSNIFIFAISGVKGLRGLTAGRAMGVTITIIGLISYIIHSIRVSKN